MRKNYWINLLATVLVCTFGIVFFQMGDLYASATPSLSISGNAEVGGTITAVVTISGPEGTYEGFSGGFFYDSSLLRLDSITQGGFSGAWDASVGNSWFVASKATIPSGTRVVSASFTCLAAGSATISLVDFEVDNIDSSASASVNIVQPVPKSADNNLQSLQVSPGSLSPAFAAGTTSYSMNVEETVSKITVSAVPADAKASVALNGVQNNLKPGANTVKITVTAENGATKVYSISVTRAQGPTPSPTPSPIPLPLMTYRGQEFVILNFDDPSSVLEGFSMTTAKYKGVDIPVIKTVLPNQTVLLLVSLLTDQGQRYFIYDEVNSTVMPYIYYSQAEKRLVFMQPNAATPIPKGYEAFDFEYDTQIITAFRLISDPLNPQILVFLLGEDGIGSFYYYDIEQKLIMPYRGEVVIVLPTPTLSPEPTLAPTTVIPSQSQTDVLVEQSTENESLGAMLTNFKNPLTLLFYIACLLILILLASMIILYIKSRMNTVDDEDVNYEGYHSMSTDTNDAFAYPYDNDEDKQIDKVEKSTVIPTLLFGDEFGIQKVSNQNLEAEASKSTHRADTQDAQSVIQHNPSVRQVNLGSLPILAEQEVVSPKLKETEAKDDVQKPIPVRLKMEMMEESKAAVLKDTAEITKEETHLEKSELHFPNDSDILIENEFEPLKFDPDL